MRILRSLLVLLTLTAILSSCKDNNEVDHSANVVGVWNVERIDFDVTINGQSLADFFDSQIIADAYEEVLKETFASTFDGVEINIKADGTYDASSPNEATTTGTWSVTGNEMTLNENSAETTNFLILSSSSSSLVLRLEESMSQDLNQDGLVDEYKIRMDLNMVK